MVARLTAPEVAGLRRSRHNVRMTGPTTDTDAAVPRRVLIAEDEALIRLDLAEMLREEGYEIVGEAGDGQEAVELAERHNPDLVIMDVKMPRRDGIDAASEIASKRIAPIVVLTAFSQRDLVERARDAGAMAYLVKPFTISDLIPAIELAVSRFSEITELEREVATLSERLETRKLVERAKGLLQTQTGHDRARGVQVDSACRHGPADHDETSGRSRPGNPRHSQRIAQGRSSVRSGRRVRARGDDTPPWLPWLHIRRIEAR